MGWYDASGVQTQDVLTSCYFEVYFLIGGFFPNPLDMRFSKVSGIASRILTKDIRAGGENLEIIRAPQQIVHDNLVLERGMVLSQADITKLSILSWEFNAAMTFFQFLPGNVVVALRDVDQNFKAAWLFRNTYPVAWKVSDLDADQNKVLIESMELAYSHFYSIRV